MAYRRGMKNLKEDSRADVRFVKGWVSSSTGVSDSDLGLVVTIKFVEVK